MKFRAIVPSVSTWLEGDGYEANALHFAGKLPSLFFVLEDNTVASFCIVEFDNGEKLISRKFHRGIWRKGGVQSPDKCHSVGEFAQRLGTHRDNPSELLADGWDGEETEYHQ